MMKRLQGMFLIAVVLCQGNAWSWGSATHKFLNQNAVQHLPAGMTQLAAQQSFLTTHAGDADARKSTDPTEDPKHYIDLESYADFAHLPADLSMVVAQYGTTVVDENGILPWAIKAATDSLTAQFRRGALTAAYQTAADLGHYVADAYQPLHCTVNYNGQLTGNTGIHSRYETTMMGQYLSAVTIHADTVRYVNDVYAYALALALDSNPYADSIMRADNAAKLTSGWTGSGSAPQSYYTSLWTSTENYTRPILQNATRDIASLWYTAWMNATVSSVEEGHVLSASPVAFSLEQNYPNPFNPTTKVRYVVGGVVAPSGSEGPEIGNRQQATGNSWVKLAVYDLLGREVAVLVNQPMVAGTHSFTVDASRLATGTYIYRLMTTINGRAYVEAKTMTLLR
jgi:hypothetical protein